MASAKEKLSRHAGELAALASPVRLSVLRLIVQGDPEGTAVGELQGKLDIPWSTLSHHLDRLSSAGLLSSRQDGKYVLYRVEFAALRALTSYLWEDCCKGGKGSCC
jgi:DNA-binding transcriptional ArsR family regulator